MKSKDNLSRRNELIEKYYIKLYRQGQRRSKIVRMIATKFFIDETTVYRNLNISDIKEKLNNTKP